ncbi:HTH-type transcriptional activator TipA [mine drainage metagenome]|uniref:HTH-type transcriptional activator TipA n=1 Tax=mine drainage metagenome TaxID=410659 RepID=A0A1J5QR59_9ZZZZ
MERTIQDVARLCGTTSRTLRHYDAIGLLRPSRVAGTGYRYYDDDALVRLQRILLLRDLGLSLPEVRRVLDSEQDPATALRAHLDRLHDEQRRLSRQVASVTWTITTLENGDPLMAETMFDGFGHARYQDEVEERWGTAAYAAGDTWWRAMSTADRDAWKRRAAELGAAWVAAAEQDVAPGSEEAQALARRHCAWLTSIPGTPGHDTGSPAKKYVLGLGEMYVADPRFAASYGGEQNATLVRDALRVYAERNL